MSIERWYTVLAYVSGVTDGERSYVTQNREEAEIALHQYRQRWPNNTVRLTMDEYHRPSLPVSAPPSLRKSQLEQLATTTDALNDQSAASVTE